MFNLMFTVNFSSKDYMLEYSFSLGIIFYVVIVRHWENDEKNSVIIWGIKSEPYETYPKTKYLKNKRKI